jgi:hypothetical protein
MVIGNWSADTLGESPGSEAWGRAALRRAAGMQRKIRTGRARAFTNGGRRARARAHAVKLVARWDTPALNTIIFFGTGFGSASARGKRGHGVPIPILSLMHAMARDHVVVLTEESCTSKRCPVCWHSRKKRDKPYREANRAQKERPLSSPRRGVGMEGKKNSVGHQDRHLVRGEGTPWLPALRRGRRLQADTQQRLRMTDPVKQQCLGYQGVSPP